MTKIAEEQVACVVDAVIVKEDLLELRPPSVVTRNIAPEMAVKSLRKNTSQVRS